MHACRLRKKAAEAEAELPAEPDEEDEEEEEEEEESEYETASEDEGFGRALLKPVFVPKVRPSRWVCHTVVNLCHALSCCTCTSGWPVYLSDGSLVQRA